VIFGTTNWTPGAQFLVDFYHRYFPSNTYHGVTAAGATRRLSRQ